MKAERISDGINAQAAFDESNIVLTFAALSDIHLKDQDSAIEHKFLSALSQLKSRYGLDAVFISGDITDNGDADSFKRFQNICKTHLQGIPIVFSLGNHDERSGMAIESVYDVLGDDFYRADADKESIRIGNRLSIIKNFAFIAVQAEGYESTSGNCLYSAETLNWLTKTLEYAAKRYPEKPIFVSTHPMIYNTAYGSDLQSQGTNWYTKELDNILSNYPQVIIFSGHVHFPINDERSIMQTDFTAVGCGSVCYMAIEWGYIQSGGGTVPKDAWLFSQGYAVEVDGKNNTRLTRLDFHNKSVIKTPWYVLSPKPDKSHLLTYSKRRGDHAQAPVFTNTTVQVKHVYTAGSSHLLVEFDAAEDSDLVHHYEITIHNSSNGDIIWRCNYLSDFWIVPQVDEMNKRLNIDLGEFSIHSPHYVSVVAVNSWGKKSAPITSSIQTVME